MRRTPKDVRLRQCNVQSNLHYIRRVASSGFTGPKTKWRQMNTTWIFWLVYRSLKNEHAITDVMGTEKRWRCRLALIRLYRYQPKETENLATVFHCAEWHHGKSLDSHPFRGFSKVLRLFSGIDTCEKCFFVLPLLFFICIKHALTLTISAKGEGNFAG